MDNLSGPRQFMTTHWSLIDLAGPQGEDQQRAHAALEVLCRSYWYPLYAFVRSRGYPVDDAQDLTQAFFTHIIETQGLAGADRQRGRFRSYLLGAMKHFLVNEWHKGQTQKRGGQVRFVDVDTGEWEARYAEANQVSSNPEYLFDREWALEVIAKALGSLRQEMTDAGKEQQFEVFKGCLTGDESLTRQQMAAQLDLTEGAVKVAIHRLRSQYRNQLRTIIAETVSNEADLEDELRHLIAVLRQPL